MMKKRILSLLLALCMTVLLAGGVYALASEPQLPYVTDAAELLSDDDELKLTQMALQVEDTYDVGVYMVIVEDYRAFDPSGVYEATYGIYHEYTMGVGDRREGIMLLLSMDARDYALFRYGEKTAYAFNDYGLAKLEEEFLDNFAENDWVGGFEDYIRACASFLESAEAGKPVSKSPVTMLLLFAAISLLIAAIVCAVLVGQMKTVHKKTSAEGYAVGAVHLTDQYDQFTHRTETRRKIERSSSSGSGHSESGGGGSGRSGKF